MDNIEFEKLVKAGIELIPKRFLRMLENIDICIEDNPTREKIRELKLRKGESLFGLYEGVPKTERWNYGQILPDKITIFKKPIESYAKSKEEIRKIVSETVWHEIAHHFGMDEREVRDLEKKRKSQK